MMKFIARSLLVISTFVAGSAYATEAATPPKAPELPQGIISNKLVSSAPLPTDFVLGKKEAPVVLIEYASLSCPHCAHFATTQLPDLQKKYIDTGKVAYILRQFPLNEPAFRGAMLVNCLGKENSEKYYLFSKVLFDAQNKWAFDGNWQDALQTISAVGGVSKEKFNECIANKAIEEEVLKSKKEATDDLKVPHTPYFFIAGEAYNGDKTAEAIGRFIDGKLATKK